MATRGRDRLPNTPQRVRRASDTDPISAIVDGVIDLSYDGVLSLNIGTGLENESTILVVHPMDDEVVPFGDGSDYGMGFDSTSSELRIVNGADLTAGIRMKLDASGNFDFVSGNLTTTGLGTFGNLDVDTLNLNGNAITDSSGSISFGDDNLSTSGNISGATGTFSVKTVTPILEKSGATSVLSIQPDAIGDSVIPGTYQSGAGVEFFKNATAYTSHNHADNANPMLVFYGATDAGQKYGTIGVDDYKRLVFGGTTTATVFNNVLYAVEGLYITNNSTGMILPNTASGAGLRHIVFGSPNTAADEPVWVFTDFARRALNFGVTDVATPQLWVHDGSATAAKHLKLYHDGTDSKIHSNSGNLVLTAASGMISLADDDLSTSGDITGATGNFSGDTTSVTLCDNETPMAGYFADGSRTVALCDRGSHAVRVTIPDAGAAWYSTTASDGAYVALHNLGTSLCDFGDGTTGMYLFDGTYTINVNSGKFSVASTGDTIVKGDLTFVDSGSGLAYGEIFVHDNATATVLAAQDTFYQVTVFDTNGASNNTTPDHTNDHITITKTGVYQVNCVITSFSGAANLYAYHVAKNNGTTIFDNCGVHRDTSVASARGSSSMIGILSLTAGDTIELWVQRLDGGAVSKNVTVENCTLSVVQIGG